MKQKIIYITLSFFMICTIFIEGNKHLKAATAYDLSNGSINIVSNGNNIDIKQNGGVISTISPTEEIEITSSSITTNNISIDISGIHEEVKVKMNNVHSNGTGSHLAAIDISGTGSIRFEFEGTNTFESNASISGNMANGFSTKSSNGIDLTFAGNGTTTFNGYNCGIYLNKGSLTIEDGNFSAISTYPLATKMGNGLYGLNASLTINNGNLYAEGNANGIYIDKTTTINGGEVNTVGRLNRGMFAASNLLVTGGKLNASGLLVGIQANQHATHYTKINGGTIQTKATTTNDDWLFNANNLKVNGGSIQTAFPANVTPKNDNNDIVYLNKLTLEDTPQTLITRLVIDSIEGVISNPDGSRYGIKDVYSDSNGILYTYLNEASHKQITAYDTNAVRYQNIFERFANDTNTATLYKDKTITFHYQDSLGSQSSSHNVGYGDIFQGNKPTSSNPEGYTFDNWYSSLAGSELFDFEQAITSNQDVYAKYIPIPLELNIPILPEATKGTYYSTTLPKAVGGVPEITYEVTNLPAGLSFNSDTLEIYGTPLNHGEFTITYTATDAHTINQTISVDSILKVSNSNILEKPSISTDSSTIEVSTPKTSDTSKSELFTTLLTLSSIMLLIIGIKKYKFHELR